MPKRVQVTWRKPGAKKPPNVVNVSRQRLTKEGRPGKWGNRFTVEEYGREECLRLFEEELKGRIAAEPNLLAPLKGKDLACSGCKPEEACHADILLKYANDQQPA